MENNFPTNQSIPVANIFQNASSNFDKQLVWSNLSLKSEIKTITEPPRIYLQKGSLKDVYLEANNNESYKINSNSQSPVGRFQTSVQIYIIFFIGIMPAAIGAFVWWLQNLRNNCFSSSEKRSRNSESICSNQDVEKLSFLSLMKKDKVSTDLVQQIARRAEKISPDSTDIHYNSYRSRLIKSRRVYSLEMPRKCLEMIEILGEGNFGQVNKSSS